MKSLSISIPKSNTNNHNGVDLMEQLYEKNFLEMNEFNKSSSRIISTSQYKERNNLASLCFPSSRVIDPLKLPDTQIYSTIQIENTLTNERLDLSPLINNEKDKLIKENHRPFGDILIVDDSVFNIITLKTLIQKTFGLKCDEAVNGEKAITMVKRAEEEHCQYKLVFMDCNMPVMDGFEATKNLRKMMNGKEISVFPIIALTALATNDDKTRCIEAGMNKHLSKPVLIVEIEEMLIEHNII